MKKVLFIIIFISVFLSVKGQKVDTSLYKTDVAKIQYCLNRYHSQRQYAYACGIAGAGAIVIAAKYGTDNRQKHNDIGYLVGGVFSGISAVLFIDAEKWLKRGSIRISPGSLKVNF